MKGLIVALSLAIFTTPLDAQNWQWPDKSENLTELPKTTTAKELRQTMLNFTSGLGVRCTYCHVGKEGRDLSEYDFASDSKPGKNQARTMMKMVSAINTQYLADFHKDRSASVEVACITCHRGNSLPILLEEELKKTFVVAGIDSTIKQYRALREQFYGGFTYNFKEGTLLRLTDRILEDSTKTSAAMQILRLNIEMYPAFALSFIRLANINEAQGNVPAALENYQQAVKLNPKDESIKVKLEKLQNKK